MAEAGGKLKGRRGCGCSARTAGQNGGLRHGGPRLARLTAFPCLGCTDTSQELTCPPSASIADMSMACQRLCSDASFTSPCKALLALHGPGVQCLAGGHNARQSAQRQSEAPTRANYVGYG